MKLAAFWKFLSLAQELMLLAVINTKFVSEALISAFQGGSFVNFSMFDMLFALFPAEYQGQVDYNVLDDNAQFHPYIFLWIQPANPNRIVVGSYC